MFKFFKRQPKTSAEIKLQQIQDLLFPKMEETELNGVKFCVDYSVDSNLDAVLLDLEEGHNDETARKTIKKVTNRLYEIRQLLQAYTEKLDKDIKYVVIDDVIPNNYE